MVYVPAEQDPGGAETFLCWWLQSELQGLLRMQALKMDASLFLRTTEGNAQHQQAQTPQLKPQRQTRSHTMFHVCDEAQREKNSSQVETQALGGEKRSLSCCCCCWAADPQESED